MAEDKDKNSKSGKIIDVATKVSNTQATSRPIIVGHGAMMKDPMVSPAPKSSLINVKTPGAKITPPSSALAKQAAAEAAEKASVQLEQQAASESPQIAENAPANQPPTPEQPAKLKAPTLVGKTILPPSSHEEVAEAAATSQQAPEQTTSSDASEAAPEKSGEAQPDQSEATASQAETPNRSSTDLSLTDPNAAAADQSNEVKIGALTYDRMQELKAGKEYKIALHKSAGQSTSWLAIVLILVLLLVGVAVAMDAGWIDLGFNVPFDFIK